MNDVSIKILSILVPVIVALIASIPSLRASKRQEKKDSSEYHEVLDRITSSVLLRAEKAIAEQDKRHSNEIRELKAEYLSEAEKAIAEQDKKYSNEIRELKAVYLSGNEILTKHYRKVIRDNSNMGNQLKAIQQKYIDQREYYEKQIVELKEFYEARISELEAQVDLLQKRVGTGKYKTNG